jgi:cystinosin
VSYSVGGFSLEFALLNPSGFFFYSVYSVGGRIDPYLGTGPVTTQDLVFALHAFIMSAV